MGSGDPIPLPPQPPSLCPPALPGEGRTGQRCRQVRLGVEGTAASTKGMLGHFGSHQPSIPGRGSWEGGERKLCPGPYCPSPRHSPASLCLVPKSVCACSFEIPLPHPNGCPSPRPAPGQTPGSCRPAAGPPQTEGDGHGRGTAASTPASCTGAGGSCVPASLGGVGTGRGALGSVLTAAWLPLNLLPFASSSQESSGGHSPRTKPTLSHVDVQRRASSALGPEGAGGQAVPRSSEGTPGTQPGSLGMRAGSQESAVTTKKGTDAPADERRRRSDASTTAPGTQPGAAGIKTQTPRAQPGSAGVSPLRDPSMSRGSWGPSSIPLDESSVTLRGRVSSLQGQASDMQDETGKVSRWQHARGLRGCRGGLGREGATEGPLCWDDTGACALTLPQPPFPGQAAGRCLWEAWGVWR